jgi:CDP-diacylglycerol--glycerol-3-phosphate 3-phosphatidyltransferase
MLMLFGLLIWYAKLDALFYVGLTGMAIIGSVMTSYTRARAESLIGQCKVGFLERAERIVMLIIGALTDRMAVVLWILAILSNWTAVQRTWYTHAEADRLERPLELAVEEPESSDEGEPKVARKASLQT